MTLSKEIREAQHRAYGRELMAYHRRLALEQRLEAERKIEKVNDYGETRDDNGKVRSQGM